MSKYVTRAEWGARPPRARTHIPSNPRGSKVHYNGGPVRIRSHADCFARVRGIQNFHMDTRRWVDVAYNLLACPHDVIFEGRGPGIRSAANGTTACNDRYYAIMLLLGDGEPLTDGHKLAALTAGKILRNEGGAGAEMGLHQECKATACPGPAVVSWHQAGLNSPAAPPPPVHDPRWPISRPLVAITAAPDGRGYWITAEDGGVFSFGSARFHGSMGGQELAGKIIHMTAPTPDEGKGYRLYASDGGVFAFGAASFHGSMGGQPLTAPVIAAADHPSGRGYWQLGADGGVFAFGAAHFHGRVQVAA